MTIYGYARVSTKDQNLSTQIEALKKAGVDTIIEEKVSGVAKNKAGLDSLLESLQEGDTLTVSRMDRLGRNTVQLLALVEELNERGVHLVILDTNIDTRTRTGKLFLGMLSLFAENERELIKEKQAAGVELAKKAGKYKGRPKKFTDNNPKLQHALNLYIDGMTVKEVCTITGVGRTTLYDAIKEKNIVRR